MGRFLSPVRQVSLGPQAQCKMGPPTLFYPNVIGYSESESIAQEGGQWTDDTVDGGFSFPP
jgi:hypothetical protein